MGVLEKNDYPYCDVSDYEVWEGDWELIRGYSLCDESRTDNEASVD